MNLILEGYNLVEYIGDGGFELYLKLIISITLEELL